MLVTGCLTRSPSVEFYTLGAPEAASQVGTSDDTSGLAVAVGPLTLPRYLDRPQLARRTNSSQIEYDETRRWAGPLGDELLRALGANLGALIPSERVVVYPAQPTFPVSYRIVIDIERFEADADDRVILHARWSIIPGKGGNALSTGRMALAEEASSRSAADLVAAHSAAIAELGKAMARTVRSLSEAPEASETAEAEAVDTAP
jgi:uncharacterized lipoprotein YmbA